MKILNIYQLLKKKPGLFLLIFLLTIVSLVNLKPQFFLLGWDNYSSYFNIKTNIFRTFFATWREYRSLGVASDAEITDIFRQIFYLLIKPVVGEKIIDQIYHLFALNLGTLAIYFLAVKTYKQFIQKKLGVKFADLFAFFASFFYLFNLNTYSVFHGPIIPYTNRFYSIPLLFLVFTILNTANKISLKKYLLLITTILFTSGSYITPTVFITMALSLGIFLLLTTNFKKTLLGYFFFLLINSFWLLPFANYTINKAAIIPLGSTFREINETTLNKPKQGFDIKKQLVLAPLTFEMNYISKEAGLKQPFLPLANEYEKFPTIIFLFIFPFLYICGSIMILFSLKRNQKLLWIPLHIFLFLFLSLKEFSPLGFIYAFISKNIPLFNIIFRMGDAKFHSFIAFAGSMAAAFFILKLFSLFNKWSSKTKKILRYAILFIKISLIAVFIIPNLITFKNYFTGNLIGFFMYNKIPTAYSEIAKTINDDGDDFRVLHLPIEKELYWRSFSWGYLGSAFLNFMLDQPYIDKTFEPASMENYYLHNRLFELQYYFPSINTAKDRQAKVQEFYSLMKKVGIKYIIFDTTQSTDIYPRGILFGGRPVIVHNQKMLELLEKLALIEKVEEYTVNIKDYAKDYRKLSPLNGKTPPPLSGDPTKKIILYKLINPDPKISFMPSARLIDPKLDNLLEIEGFDLNIPALQSKKNNKFALYPFLRNDHQVQIDGDKLNLNILNQHNPTGEYLISKANKIIDPDKSHLINIYGSINKNELSIEFFEQYLPTINNKQFVKNIGQVVIDLTDLKLNFNSIDKTTSILADWDGNLSNEVRLKIGKTIIPLTLPLGVKESYLGSFITHGSDFDFQLLHKYKNIAIPSKDIFAYQPTHCYGDPLPDYEANISHPENQTALQVKNGSMCSASLLMPLMDEKTSYLELSLNVSGESKDLDPVYFPDSQFTSKPKLKNVITSLNKPNHLRICLRETLVDTCLNKHQLVDINRVEKVLIPIDGLITNESNLIPQIALTTTGVQESTAILSDVNLDLFESTFQQTLTLPKDLPKEERIILDSANKLEINFPKPQSLYGFFTNDSYEGFHTSNALCPPGSFRTIKILESGQVSYFENCDRALSQALPFNSKNFLLWTADYNIGSGQQANLIVNNKMGVYFQQRASLYQGYPKLPSMKLFQSPEFNTTEDEILSKLSNLSFQTASVFYPPKIDTNDVNEKHFNFHQASENEGLFILKNFNVTELPNTWRWLELKPAKNSELNYQTPNNTSFHRILPSLWKVELAANNDQYLMKFNEAYDKQWHLYANFTDLILGKKASADHFRCDGYANCFDVSSQTKSKSFYIFYEPEKLSFLGWLITFLTIVFFTKMFVKKPRKVLN